MKRIATFFIIALVSGIITISITSTQNVSALPCRVAGPNEFWIDDPPCLTLPFVIKFLCQPCLDKFITDNFTAVIPKDVLNVISNHDAYVLMMQNGNVSVIPTDAATLTKILKQAKIMP